MLLPIPTELASLPRSERTIALRAFLDEARQTVVSAHAAGSSGDETARLWSDSVDRLVIALFSAGQINYPSPRPITVAAVGGYGRTELTPSSDLDLWFIVDDPSESNLTRLAEEIIYPLWDLKLEVGHAVRSIDQTIALGRQDLTAATALGDLRHIAGSTTLTQDLAQAGRTKLFQRSPENLVQQLAEEKRARHARFGDTVFLLEPDLKNGEGGYRDLLVGLWAAKFRFGVRDFSDLPRLELASARQTESLIAARRFFLTVRTAAHLYARRRQDRLLFEVQEAIAPALFPSESTEHSVEQLMQGYYRHAQSVKREAGRLLERATESPRRRIRVRPVDESFQLCNGQLAVCSPERFRDSPGEMVRIFRVALDLDVSLHASACDLIAEACARSETAEALAASPRAAQDFLFLLTTPRDLRSPSLLHQMHELGLLTALMPEFGPCTGRVQHDIYHVFTVDQHSLYAVDQLKAIARGERNSELPIANQAMREISDLAPLHLGTLLHDVGKPLGKAHSVTGAALARTIAARLRMAPEEVARTEFLVRHHLLLAHLSQRRDLNDTAMIAHLAGQLGDEETLRQLYLLTIADMSMVAPSNMTSWKEQLLRELYVRTLSHFRRGPDLAGEDYSRRVTERRARVASLLSADPASLDSWFEGVPTRYLMQTAPRLVGRHIELSHQRAERSLPIALSIDHRRRRGYSELSIVCEDIPGLLAKISAVLLALRIDVLGAQIASRKNTPAEAIDVFLVRDRSGGVLTVALDRLAKELGRVIGGEIAPETIVEPVIGERRRATLPVRVKPRVPTEIEIDNEVASDFTVVDVYTQDRPGVLYTITQTLSALGIDIQLSKVATEADRVADVFYLRTASGNKLDSAETVQLARVLESALERLPD